MNSPFPPESGTSNAILSSPPRHAKREKAPEEETTIALEEDKRVDVHPAAAAAAGTGLMDGELDTKSVSVAALPARNRNGYVRIKQTGEDEDAKAGYGSELGEIPIMDGVRRRASRFEDEDVDEEDRKKSVVSLCALLAMNSFTGVYGFVSMSMSMLVLPKESEFMFHKNQAFGLALLLGIAGISQLIGPLAGYFSDHCRSQYGRRRPFALIGSIIAVFSLVVLSILKRFYMLSLSLTLYRVIFIAAFSLLNLSMNACYAAYAGLIPDMVPKSQLGVASGVMAVSTSLGSLIGMWLVGFLNLEPYSLYTISILVTSIWVWSAVKESHAYAEESDQTQRIDMAELARVYTISLEDEPDFFWVWFSRLLYYTGMSVQAFMQYFLRDVIGRTNDAKFQTAIVAMIAMGSGSIVSVPCGRLSDRIGRKPLVYISCVIMSSAYLGWTIATKMWHVLLWSVVFGIANGTYLSVDYALACDTMPDRTKAAQALGVWGVAAFLGTTCGPIISGPVLFFVGKTDGPDSYSRAGYAALLFVGAVFVLLAALTLRHVAKVK